MFAGAQALQGESRHTMREPSSSLSCTDVEGCVSSTPAQVVWKLVDGSGGGLALLADGCSPVQLGVHERPGSHTAIKEHSSRVSGSCDHDSRARSTEAAPVKVLPLPAKAVYLAFSGGV